MEQSSNGKRMLFGFQHLFAMFGASVLVPLITGLPVQVVLVGLGIGTLLMHFISGLGKAPPVFLGSSFAYIAGMSLITSPTVGLFAGTGMDETTKLAYATGAIMVSAVLYFILAGVVKFAGVERFMKWVPTVVTAPTVILIGVMLAPHAISQANQNWLLAIATLVIMTVAAVWGKGMIKIIPILLGIAGAMVLAVFIHLIGGTNPDGSAIIVWGTAGTGLIGMPGFFLPRFDLMAILIMAPFALATIAEHIGDMVILSRLSGNKYTDNLPRTLLGDGVATMVSGAIGGAASTTYSENVGVVTLTKVYDPRPLRWAALYAIILGFVPIFASVVYAIPASIIGGASFLLYGMIAAVGIRNLVDERTDLADMKNCIIVAVMLVTGLGLRFGPEITFALGDTSIPIGRLGVAIAIVLGVILNRVLPNMKKENPDGEFRTSDSGSVGV